MGEIIDQIRRLAAEAASEKYELPGTWDLMRNHPGVLAYQIKTQPHYQKDMQRASWLGKVADLQDKYRAEGRGLEFREPLNPEFLDAVKRRQEIASPYWNRGVLAFGQPLREGLNWAGSIPATAFNAGRMVAGVEGAADDFSDSVDLASARTLGLLVGRQNPTQLAWEQERRSEEDRPLMDVSALRDTQPGARILPTADNVRFFEPMASRGQTTGDNLLQEMGVPAGWGRQLGGALAEATVDPVSGARAGIRALLGRNLPRAAVELGSEMALPGIFIAAQEGLKRQAEHRRRQEETAGY